MNHSFGSCSADRWYSGTSTGTLLVVSVIFIVAFVLVLFLLYNTCVAPLLGTKPAKSVFQVLGLVVFLRMVLTRAPVVFIHSDPQRTEAKVGSDLLTQ